MAYKERSESLLLKIQRILNIRMELTEDEKKYYLYQEKGYTGEVQFDKLTEKLQSNCYILNDLQLLSNKSCFQIDTSMIFQDTYYEFEVKNYEGEYCYENDNFKTLKGIDITNPLDQLKRGTFHMRQLLKSLGSKLNVEGYVIFINPQFTLYSAPSNLPIILPSMLEDFLKRLDKKPCRLNNSHKNLADKLISLHQTESPYTQLPKYEYEQVKKGMTCKLCHSFSVFVVGKKMVCKECTCEELVALAVMRNVEEFKLLFPERKITTNTIQDWCRIVPCKKTISRALGKNLKIIGKGQWAYYE